MLGMWTRGDFLSNTYIHNILKINIQMKPEMLLWGLIDKKLEKTHSTLFFIYDKSSEIFIRKMVERFGHYTQWKGGWWSWWSLLIWRNWQLWLQKKHWLILMLIRTISWIFCIKQKNEIMILYIWWLGKNIKW